MVTYVRPNALPPASSVNSDAAIVVDNDTAVEAATPKQVVDAGRPVASEAQALAGTNNETAMTPLTTKQALDNYPRPFVTLADVPFNYTDPGGDNFNTFPNGAVVNTSTASVPLNAPQAGAMRWAALSNIRSENTGLQIATPGSGTGADGGFWARSKNFGGIFRPWERIVTEAYGDVRYSRTFGTKAALVAATGLAVGAYVRTLGYHAPGDGGGNVYQIVAAATGTVDGGRYFDLTGSTGQARGLFPEGVRWEHFGAKGDAGTTNLSPTDDRVAMQACLDYMANASLEAVTSDRASGGTSSRLRGAMVISGRPGAVYGVSGSLNYRSGVGYLGVEGMTVEHTAFRAIGTGWAATDYIMDPGGGPRRVHFVECVFSCERKCGGIKLGNACEVISSDVCQYSGATGVELAGSNAKISSCDMWEHLTGDADFYDYTKYTGTAVKITQPDCVIENSRLRWSGKLLEANNALWRVRDCHLMNGMEDYAANSGTPRPDGSILAEISASGDFENVYFDSGKVITNNAKVTFKGCKFYTITGATPASHTTWIEVRPSVANDTADNTRIFDCYIQNDPTNKRMIDWASGTGGNSWEANTATAHTQVNGYSESRPQLGSAVRFGDKEVVVNESAAVSYTMSLHPFALHYIRGKDSSGWCEYGMKNDSFVISPPARVDMAEAGSALIVPKHASNPSSTVSGGIYYNTTANKLRLYNGSAWVDLN